MGKKIRGTGVVAAAQAVKYADVDVISSYPIRPYTGTMIELAKMVANGELDAEFVHAEGEHGQLSIVLGASASGARVFTGSSGVGVTYAFETYSPIAGSRLPVQMMIADRTLDPPGDFGSEHTDALSTRDQGWLMGWAATPQEVFDNHLINYRIGEDHRVLLPQMVCQDGYFVSHIPGDIELPDPKQVKEFLPPYKLPHPLDPKHPVSHGPQIRPDQGAALEAQRANSMEAVKPIIKEVVDDFNRIFGRKYDPFVEEFMTEDAEVVFFISGAHAETAKFAIRRMRNHGDKVGLVRPRWIRPWPTEDLREIMPKFKVVGVVETNNSFGSALSGGILSLDLAASLYNLPKRPLLTSFMGGLGGEVIGMEEFEFMARVMLEAAKKGKVERETYWLGFES